MILQYQMALLYLSGGFNSADGAEQDLRSRLTGNAHVARQRTESPTRYGKRKVRAALATTVRGKQTTVCDCVFYALSELSRSFLRFEFLCFVFSRSISFSDSSFFGSPICQLRLADTEHPNSQDLSKNVGVPTTRISLSISSKLCIHGKEL